MIIVSRGEGVSKVGEFSKPSCSLPFPALDFAAPSHRPARLGSGMACSGLRPAASHSGALWPWDLKRPAIARRSRICLFSMNATTSAQPRTPVSPFYVPQLCETVTSFGAIELTKQFRRLPHHRGSTSTFSNASILATEARSSPTRTSTLTSSVRPPPRSIDPPGPQHLLVRRGNPEFSVALISPLAFCRQ